MRRPPRYLRWLVFVLLAVTLLVVTRDAVRFNPAQEAATSYIYDIVGWHATNFLSKWVHRVVRFLPWNSLTQEEKLQRLDDYFALAEETRALQDRLAEISARGGDDSGLEASRLHESIDEVEDRRRGLRNDVEETIESAISSVIVSDGFASWGELVFPPVDVRLTRPPKLLVTSPRDRIERRHNVLLRAGIKIDARAEVENKVLTESNLAALVTNIGGVATYPASIPSDRSLRSTLRISAHEWLHHFYFFRPLGQNMFSSRNMEILNETMSDIAGREIGDRAFELLGAMADEATLTLTVAGDSPQGEAGFDFDEEMRETRRRVDELLGQGQIVEAESYMEQRRLVFVENGFHIRKLNQAFFGFNGTYAESPTSVSPIADQLKELRRHLPNLKAFVKTMAGVSSYREFLDKLEEVRTADDR